MVRDTIVVSFPMNAFAYVPITVTPVNDAPVAVDDIYAVEAGVPFVTTTRRRRERRGRADERLRTWTGICSPRCS